MMSRMQTVWIPLAALLLTPLSAPAGNDSAVTAFNEPATNVTYTYPSDFQSTPELKDRLTAQIRGGDIYDPEKAAMAKCLFLSLLATKGFTGTPDGEVGIIFLIRIEYGCVGRPNRPEDLSGETQGIAKLLLKNFGFPLTEDSLNFKLDTHPAAFVQGSAEAKQLGPDRMLHAATVCTLFGANTLCWIILDTNHKAMPALVATTVTFPNRPPVPADMVQAW
jgi:hypothetical protein